MRPRACACEELGDVDARGRECRKDAEDDACGKAHKNNEDERAQIERGRLHMRDVAGVEPEESADEEPREADANHARGAAEQERLGEHLANEPAATCPQRRANAELVAVAGSPCKQKVRRVTARDQQHEAYDGEQQKHQRTHRTEHLLRQRFY
jgi:hypothetical protein